MHFQMFKLDLEKTEEPEIKLPTSAGSSKKQESSRKTYFCFIDYAKAFDCVDHHKLWKILKDMRIPDHLTCLLRNLYADQEATVRSFQDGGGWVVDRKAEGPYEVKRAENHPLPHFSQPQEPSRSPAEA